MDGQIFYEVEADMTTILVDVLGVNPDSVVYRVATTPINGSKAIHLVDVRRLSIKIIEALKKFSDIKFKIYLSPEQEPKMYMLFEDVRDFKFTMLSNPQVAMFIK